MSEIIDSFNRIKNIIYKKNETTRTLEDLVRFIQKKNKTEDDIQLISQLNLYSKAMVGAVNDLGTESILLNTKIVSFQEGLDIEEENIETHIKEIILIVDKFIDSLSAMIRTFDFKSENFQLKKSEHYVKSYRANLIKKLHEFKLKSMINYEDETNLYMFVNDVIDVVIKEGYKLRLKKLNEVLSRDYS